MIVRENVGIPQDKLLTIMKRFLSSKKDTPDKHKYFLAVDGIDFMATTDGSAVNISLENKYDYRKGISKFIAPLPKGKVDEIDVIEGYPDIKGVFEEDLSKYYESKMDNVTRLIHIHEAMHKLKSLGGSYHNAMMRIHEELGVEFSLYGNEAQLSYIETESEINGPTGDLPEVEFIYDIELMISILKGLKDLKVDELKMYYRSNGDKIFLIGSKTGYEFKFALAKKLVR